MADLPEANVTVDDEAGGFAGGTGYAVVLACVAENDDITPRVFASGKGLLDQHGYAAGASYVASHIDETGKPVVFVGLPIATAGFAGSFDSSGVTGTSKITVAGGTDGILEEVDGVVTVVAGGTVGTDQITFTLSLDGGRTEKLVRLGTASSYTVPYVGIVISFGSGTLVAADEYTFRTHAPKWDNDGLTAARRALAKQRKLSRSWLVIGDLPSSTYAGYVTTQVNAYETANKRFTYARASVNDRRLAKMSKRRVSMVGQPQLTFAEVGATGDTITRDTGSWVTDGFQVGDCITVAGSLSNNFTDAKITGVSATVLTLDTQDLVAEVTTSGVTVIGSTSLTFAEVGSTLDTITRVAGSWVDDGFAAGMTVSIDGTASNDGTTAVISAVTATVMTLTTYDLAAEVIASHRVDIVQVQTMAAWIAAQDTAFASVDAQKRIDLSAGRGRKTCPITGWAFRRPAFWFASIREYQHDLHITCWWKALGPLDGVSLDDEEGNTVEFDEETDGGALAARFTCLRTWSNGPDGAFVAQSLTRATESSLLSLTHNLAVCNLACSVVQAETENAVGQVLVLKSDGKGTEESLSLIEGRVNSQLQISLLQDNGEGPRASSAVWRASRNDILNVTGATLNGTLELLLNGTLETINTTVKVQTAG